MDFLDRLRLAFSLRPVIGIHRELRRLNDTLDSLTLHYQIPSKQDQLIARKAAQLDADKIDNDPRLLSTPTSTPAQQAADELRDRARRGVEIDPTELLGVAEWLDEEEGDKEKGAAW